MSEEGKLSIGLISCSGEACPGGDHFPPGHPEGAAVHQAGL